MRTTTVIAPLRSSRKIIQRPNGVSATFRRIGIFVALLLFGLVFLILSPIAWCVRKIGALFSGHQ
jgi:hypothetical protein